MNQNQNDQRQVYNNNYQYQQMNNGQMQNMAPRPKKHKGLKVFFTFLLIVVLLGAVGVGGAYVAMKTDFDLDLDLNFLKADSDDSDQDGTQEENTSDKKDGKDEDEAPLVAWDATTAVDQALPAVVSITNSWTESIKNDSGDEIASGDNLAKGSGVIFDKTDSELLIVSNNHVVTGAETLSVEFVDGTMADAKIKGTDADVDIAVISVPLEDLGDSTLDAIHIIEIGDSDELRLGEPTIAIGNARGYGQSVTVGVVSATHRALEGMSVRYIQTDAAINHGNSGGALLNSQAQLIGINTLGTADSDGMGFAIPITDAWPIVERLGEQEAKDAVTAADRGYLGVRVTTPSGVDGAYVAEVVEDSAAESGEIEEGDIIIKLDNNDITTVADLGNYLNYYESGELVTVTVLRKGSSGYEEVAIDITLDGRDDAESGTV